MAGTNKNRKNLTNGPIIILVEPQLPENIGMVARAMANFGLSQLRLVKPREEFPNEKARVAASKADHVINEVIIFNTLSDAIADLHYIFATTARERCGFKTVKSAVEAANILRQREKLGQKTGILFGRERWGLENSEISLVDEIVTFPVNPAFASLNIAQAVLLMSYEWMKSGLDNVNDTAFRTAEMEPADKATLHGFLSQLEDALDTRGYFRPRERKEVMLANMRSVFTRANFSESEVRLLRGIVSSLDHFSPQFPRGSGPPIGRDRKKLKTSVNTDG
ncbi:RNA methyltransferase [Bartonella doshiae]|uniref:tRNA (cytidine/uridine-2'-O-)-methyltransferase TrmJ n=2 Tax=Bartonella doshiae TaxID=33044 RepID=A0A380ZDZ8_BARDO|nr:RNA methyltransferase [Bartonella doshiae]EJF82218.1 RNA methyltransferase, TrmH family, group 1 [Bartonella doshiae NCTC 12862 = ATCC 700133]MBB6159590.1 tRNA/rRNA methyltransferase [Bartonella doshiae]SUV44861.1 tRNA (cytidine/uridine-2'-O-)-methyltransferase TrmJ [Bartonella doshiae]